MKLRFLRTPLGRIALIVGASLVVWLARRYQAGEPEPRPGDLPAEAPSASAGDGDGQILQAYRTKQSGLVVESGGLVEKTLPDDLEGSRHQKFILRLANRHTVLVSHNIDLAPRVPLSEGDRVTLRGQFEYNDRGGVVHWTHHDPKNRRPGGWIRHEGETYR